MINEAKVAFCAGYEFGKQGEAFLRMNVACPRCTLTKALEQMEKGDQRSVASVIPVNDAPCEIRNFLKRRNSYEKREPSQCSCP